MHELSWQAVKYAIHYFIGAFMKRPQLQQSLFSQSEQRFEWKASFLSLKRRKKDIIMQRFMHWGQRNLLGTST